jgi:hypothetical protein
MDWERFYSLIESFRKQAIGEPRWIEEKKAYEYDEKSPKVVAVLKLVRATHGVSALHVLWRSGLFIDMGAIVRCINDCTDEIRFLLEDFPKASAHVEQFVKRFFEGTIDGFLSVETPDVETKKIRAAAVRVIKGRHDHATQQLMERIYKAFCGYVHANYSQVMEVYNGHTQNFNLRGVPEDGQREKWHPYLDVMANNVLLAAAFIAQTLEMNDYHSQLMRTIVEVAS